MFKVKILSIGKTKEKWLVEGCNEYEKRLKNRFKISWLLLKDNDALHKAAKQSEFIILLDPLGEKINSLQFSKNLFHYLETQKKISFIIGGAEGIPEALKNHHISWSLSPLTFTHQMTRLILLEQIYRAAEIQKKSSYHK